MWTTKLCLSLCLCVSGRLCLCSRTRPDLLGAWQVDFKMSLIFRAEGTKVCIYKFKSGQSFDRESTNYLLRVLSSFGFGPMFISCIKLLYTNISSSEIVDGHIGLEFPVKRSGRQGCAFSPLLFVLSMESFALRIRREPGFCGSQMPGNLEQVRLSLYTTLVTHEDSISLIFSICREFSPASGAKLNMDKTCGIWLGRWKDRGIRHMGSNGLNLKKLLVVHFGYGEIFLITVVQ